MSSDDADTTSPPLLETKLHAPRRRRGVVPRPRLTDRLVTATLPSLTIVAAPAGFGKTTLLAEWFGHLGGEHHTSAWLSLDPGDNDPTVFWTYVIAAVQRIAPGAGQRAAALVQASQPLEPVVASLLNDLAGVEDEIVLVLDDYHVIESVELQASVAFLLEHLPPQVHLVLGSRADPPLPLARLRALGELLEVRATDLRFTADEAATYFNDAMGLHLTVGDVDALEARTEGWIAALQLAALSMQGRDDTRGFIESFAGDDRFVVDYLAEEVLERQPDEVRSFLLETAVLDRLTGTLCDAVTGRPGGKAMLDRIDRANLFLVPLDDRRQWYRYHHLFADVLRARLVDEAPEQVGQLHRRASDWYAASGDPAEAIHHAVAGHHIERAAELIEVAAPSMFRTRQEVTIRRWITALPEDIFPDRPVLSIERVGALLVNGDATGVEPLLDGIERWLDPAVDASTAIVFDHAEFADLPAQVAVYRAALALVAGDVPGARAHAERALALTQPTDDLRRGSAAALVGLAQWTVGDVESAIRRYRESIASLTAAGHISDVLGCTIALADMSLTLGRLQDATRAYQAGLELAVANDVVRGTADMHVGLAEVLLERLDLSAASDHLAASALLGDPAGLPQHAYRWRVATAHLRQAEGDLDAAIALLEEAEDVFNTDLSPAVRPVSAVLARTRLAAGDIAAARRWATERGFTADDELSYLHEYEHLTLVRVLVATAEADRDRRTADDAARLSERLLAAADAGHRAGPAIEILIGLTLAHQARGDQLAARTALGDALTRAEPEGHLRPFVEELPALAPLLRSLPGPGAVAEQARRVLAAVPADGREAGGPRDSSDPSLVDELSLRELDVLRLLRSDLSGPDIARELVVSLNTVRTHTKHIYMKLGVSNRREAVRRADELGL